MSSEMQSGFLAGVRSSVLGGLVSGRQQGELGLDSHEIVMGLSWSGRAVAAELATRTGLYCELSTVEGELLDLIHAGQPRHSNGSVVHTGNAVPGDWDCERIFIFLDALPPEVAQVSLSVRCTTPLAAAVKSRAFCHVSDRQSEQVLLSRALPPSEAESECLVALALRKPLGWCLMDVDRMGGESSARRMLSALSGWRHASPS